MRLRIFGTAAFAAGILASASGEAADGPPDPDPPRLAIVCQGSVPADARIAACEALAHDPRLPLKLAAPVFSSIGYAQIDKRQYSLAVLSFTDALRSDAGFWPAYWARAELLEKRREYAAAISDWSAFLVHQPNLAGAYARRAVSVENLERWDQAIADYTKAIELASPTDPIARYYAGRGYAHSWSGQFETALTDYTEAIKRDDHDPVAFAGRGRVELLKGDAASAVSDFTKASELVPNSIYTPIWLWLAQTESGADGTAELRRRTAPLMASGWPSPLVRVLLGEVKAGDVSPAQSGPSTWTADERIEGGSCEKAFFAGEFYRVHGDKEQAITFFKAALATHMTEFIEYHAAAIELARLTR